MTGHAGRHAIRVVLRLAPALAVIAFALVTERSLTGSEPQQVVQQSSAEAGVRDTLHRYSTALQSLDPDAVKKVQPSIPTEDLAKAFKEMRELKVDIDAVRMLSQDAASARVSCRVTQTLTPRAGAKRTSSVTRVIRLRRLADSWVIEGFER
jgi:hypothetical protein